jgi:two-component system invasion response regulator UvrY
MIRVIVVDDHPVVRLGIKRLFDSHTDIKIIGEAGSGEHAIHLVKSLKPDVVLMDLHMPGISGLVATHRITQNSSQEEPKPKVIIVTVRNIESLPERLIHVGATGYITKSSDAAELEIAIRKVSAGGFHITPEVAQLMALRQVTRAAQSPFSQLSDREMEVLWMVTRGQKVSGIARKLCLSPKTINTYRYRLFEKLKVKNDVGLTHLAMRHGLLEEGEEDWKSDGGAAPAA